MKFINDFSFFYPSTALDIVDHIFFLETFFSLDSLCMPQSLGLSSNSLALFSQSLLLIPSFLETTSPWSAPVLGPWFSPLFTFTCSLGQLTQPHDFKNPNESSRLCLPSELMIQQYGYNTSR